VNGVGNVIANNEVSQGPHAGIFYFGNDHEIAGNDVHAVALRTGDVGAIYTGRDWAGRGHKVHHNYIHDVQGVGQLGATALYIDDQSSGVELRDNIVKNVRRGVLVGGGRDNVITRNAFFDVKTCIKELAAGQRQGGRRVVEAPRQRALQKPGLEAALSADGASG
jgi:hypothetical protein